MYYFKAFKATSSIETCRKFREGHKKVLFDYGISNITTNNDDWMFYESVYGITAEDEHGEIVGGIRIHVADDDHPLPVEDAVGEIDPKIFGLIRQYSNTGTGELCGLWNAKSVAGIGISLLLIRAGISVVNQIKLNSLFTICADYTMPMVKKVGFEVEDSLGNKGEFIYPNENYIARVLRRMNAITLETAQPEDRERILNLRNNPVQITSEQGPKGDISINYNLIISNV
ncbi:MAG: hypothetical protein J7604_02925 [Sporocytophaga sp.]|uniref:hypothetical protein n=1 Tax=Sporocytophaga sp. TaxID=2231183 RepID=UPI001B2C363A|nr:hypothetical protein [Sporocytophaga sp.]MBO9699132.1 hypothetical protein [Sporocytophaga sp.]